MLKSLIILPDGTALTSGPMEVNNIRSTALTECVNSGEELTMGSTCAAMMEVIVQTPRGALSLHYGDEVTLYRVGDAGQEKAGVFILEKPERTSTHILKLTGYDRVTKLDRDLTAWLKSLDGWPYALLEFAGMVCEACGLVLVTTSIPNGDYPVPRIDKEATGRQLMEWIGQIACRFCRATADGDIELAWYTPSGISIQPTGEQYFFRRTLTYQDYAVAPIEAVQVRLTDSEDGAPVPTVPEGTHRYLISGNPIFTSITGSVLDNIMAELGSLHYTPCKVTVPATMDIRAGHTVEITDINGVTITTLVMSRTQRGQRAILECTGSPRRDSSTALHNASGRDQAAANAHAAFVAGKDAVRNQTPEEVFNALTNNGAIQGLYLHEGKIYINAEFVSIVNLVAQSIVSGMLKSVNERAWFDLDGGFFAVDGKPDDNGKITGVRIRDYMLYGLRRNEDGSDAVTTFELLSAAEETRFTDGTLIPSGLPIKIWSSGGLHLGREGDTVQIMGKTLVWVPNSDGQTFTLMGM